MGLLTWVIVEDKAQWVHWLFDTADSLIPADISLRGLAGELERRGVLTASGKGRWSEMQVKCILTNPKYCGEGRNQRWYVQWDKRKNPRTGIVREKNEVHDRMRNADAWKTETHKITTEAIPPIITPEQFHRVQDKLKAAAALHNRGGPRRTDPAATSTLLDGGFVRCAECGGKMTRYWKVLSPKPHYECNHNAGVPTHPHKSHHIPAPDVDCLALCMLAKALTDPQTILELANAAEAQIATAETDAALAVAAQSACQQRLANIQQQQNNLLAGLAALSKVPGMEQQVADIRAQLAKLDHEREEAEEERTHAHAPRDNALERAALLRNLFTARDFIADFTPGSTFDPTAPIQPGEPTHLEIGWPGTRMGKDGETIHYSILPLDQAAALLGMEESELGVRGLPIQRGEPFSYVTDDGEVVWDESPDTVDTVDVVGLLLRRMPRDRLRKLFDDLGVVVKVARPWSREERKKRGFTPVWARVSLTMLGAIEVRIDGTKALICP